MNLFVRQGRVVLALLLVFVMGGAAACKKSDAQIVGITGAKIAKLNPNLVPAEILGLRVAAEDVAASLKDSNRSFADAVGLYSLRTDDLVMATLQVSRLLPGANVKSSFFRRSIVEQIGSSRSRETRWGEESVWLTTSTKSKVAIWFRGHYIFQLSMRDEYDQPRTLLRELLAVNP